MTEAEWDACTEPPKMLAFLRDNGQANDRKVRLFAAACCRRVWHLLTDRRSQNAVEVAEQFADGLASSDTLNDAETAAGAALWAVKDERDRVAPAELPSGTHEAAEAAEMASWAKEGRFYWGVGGYGAWEAAVEAAAYGEDAAAQGREAAHQAALLRDIFGPLAFAASLRAWHQGTAVRLARAAYEERELPSGHLDPARLAVLADALEEAGLTDVEVLRHLRSPGPHVRGCWALDLLLDRGVTP
jgi:hypothetical protein